jgi:translation initiation factor IF-1
MLIIMGIWLAAGGAVACLAGFVGIRSARSLRRWGVSTCAMVVPRPRSSEGDAGGQSGATLIQYSLAGGQVLERHAPRRIRKSAWLSPGQRVLVWYDPADPQNVLISGPAARVADIAFLSAGIGFILIGAVIAAALGH